jgi:hypothetical protein
MDRMTFLDRDALRQRALNTVPVALDDTILWDCSSKGWHCCVDYGIPVMPYDVIRLRHSTGKTSRDLINEQAITFQWSGGHMAGWLAQIPHQGNHRACMFYEELTNQDIRRIRDEDPARFESFPPTVQQAADRQQGGSYRVAGLCSAHANRPEACRSFPFMRHADWEQHPDREPVSQVHRCGTCALSTPTTVRQIVTDNGLEQFWRADRLWQAVKFYLISRGLANTTDASYRALPLDADQRTQFWGACFNPDILPEVAERFEGQSKSTSMVTSKSSNSYSLMPCTAPTRSSPSLASPPPTSVQSTNHRRSALISTHC